MGSVVGGSVVMGRGVRELERGLGRSLTPGRRRRLWWPQLVDLSLGSEAGVAGQLDFLVS